jgi:SAM-dependent methyltransferase
LDLLEDLMKKPAPYEPGEPLFWDDPHISAQMLKAHLDPEIDAASRKPAAIDRTCDWLVEHLRLIPGDRVLDLGCGPGLYATRLAKRGIKVTGIDYSRRSIDYARRAAAEQGLDIEYRYQDYLSKDYLAGDLSERFDLAIMVYCDFAVLSDEQLGILLGRVARALKLGGKFVFDVFTPENPSYSETSSWSLSGPGGGFWSPEPYLSLHRKFHYPETDTWLDQYLIVPEDLSVKLYRIWDRVFTPESIRKALDAHGFVVDEVWGGLEGVEYAPGATTLGVVASPQKIHRSIQTIRAQ